ncbi:SRPBCC family protein [Maribellus mangrovi]|uniref:SRPBCC family protein n=1 Tax=Maribellus mangrovi TaxID=3133146 RepID=UPI0030EF6753
MEPVIIRESFAASDEKVWAVLTVLEEMKQWYFDNIDAFRAEVGARSKFEVVSRDRIFTHLWEVEEAIPGKKLVVNWKYAEYPGDSIVIFELEEKSGHTELILTMKVLEDFPDDIPEFKRESCVGGWEFFIRERLKSYLENNS